MPSRNESAQRPNRPRAPEADRSTGASTRWLWTVAGATIGLLDFLVLIFFDANLTVSGHDLTYPLLALFLFPYGALGWAGGGLVEARRRAERDRQTIEAQLAALEKTQRALVQEEKLAGIGRLAAGVAHEVRNPLGVIRASASMVQESFDPGCDQHRALGFICDETDRLDRLIHALLTFAKPQPVERVPTDLTKVVDQAMQLAAPEASRHRVAIELALDVNTPPVNADPDRLSQAIYGLLLNAIQAFDSSENGAESGTPTSALPGPAHPTSAGVANGRDRRVEIRCAPFEDQVEIRVRDSGPGIPDVLRDQIFEPFVTTKSSGTGLGLPMALRLIEAQGGSIELEEHDASSKGGACFRIALPVHRPAEVEAR